MLQWQYLKFIIHTLSSLNTRGINATVDRIEELLGGDGVIDGSLSSHYALNMIYAQKVCFCCSIVVAQF